MKIFSDSVIRQRTDIAEKHPFADLLSPMAPSTFLESFWEKHSLHLKGVKDRWPFDVNREQFFKAITELPSVRMIYENEKGLHREASIDPKLAPTIYSAGNSICANSLELGQPELKSFVSRLNSAFPYGAEFHFNGYLSPRGKGFGLHFDDHSVWILQIEGKKRWFFGDEPHVSSPLHNFVYPSTEKKTYSLPWYDVTHPKTEEMNEIVLEPGDLLYLPAGTWHHTEAEGHSLSLTLSQRIRRMSSVIINQIERKILCSEVGRNFLPHQIQSVSSSNEEDEVAARKIASEVIVMLKRVVEDLSVDSVVSAAFASSDTPAAPARTHTFSIRIK